MGSRRLVGYDSPQCSAMKARASSRRRTISDHSVPVGRRGGAEGDRDAAGAEQPRPGGEDAAGAPNGHRHHRATGVDRGAERAEPEREQARHVVERPLGEDAERLAARERRPEVLDAFDPLRLIVLAERDVAGAADDRPENGETRQAGLRGEARPGRKHAHQQRRVQVARVVRDEDHGAGGRGPLAAGHLDPAAGEYHQEPRPAADDAVDAPPARPGPHQRPCDRARRQHERDDPGREAEAARPRAPLRRRRPCAGRGEPDPLAGRAAARASQAAGPPRLARGRTADLAARRLGDGAGRRQHDAVRGDAERVGHRTGHGAPQRGELGRVGEPRLRHDHEPLRAALGIRGAEGGDASGAHTRYRGRRRFRFMGVQVAAALDDQVLGPPGEEEIAVGDVAEVAGVEPAIVAGDRARRARVAVVAGRGRRPPESDPSFAALGGRVSAGVHDLELVAGKGPPAGDEAQRLRLVGRRRHRVARGLEGRALDAVDARRPAGRGRGQPDRALGEAVDRQHGPRIESVGLEPLGEAPDRLRQNRLGAVEQDAHRAEVEPVELAVRDPGRAEIEREVGSGGERPPVGVERPEPADRARQEGEGRHENQGGPEVQGAQPGADQPHVVVERQPAHGDVAGTDREPLLDRADVGETTMRPSRCREARGGREFIGNPFSGITRSTAYRWMMQGLTAEGFFPRGKRERGLKAGLQAPC